MSHYYTVTRQVMLELSAWVTNLERQPWSDFNRKIILRYGCPKQRLERMLNDYFPQLKIVDDQLVVRDDYSPGEGRGKEPEKHHSIPPLPPPPQASEPEG